MKKNLVSLLCISVTSMPVIAASAVDVQIVDRSTGKTLETWGHRGRLYVVGTPGDRYALNLKNRMVERMLAVLSVDGVNVVSGQTAAASQSGYVLSAGQAAEIIGWRKSLDEVAAFYLSLIHI